MNNALIKKILFLMLGYGCAQLILVLATPVLTRLYSPEMFAYFGYIYSIACILLPLASLQYEYAIPLIKIQKLVFLLTKLCFILVSTTSLVLLCIFFILNTIYYQHELDNKLLLVCFIIVLLNGYLQVFTLPLLADGKTTPVAHGKLIQNLGMVIVQILIPIFFYSSSLVLLLGVVFGLFLNIIYYRFFISSLFTKARVRLTKRTAIFLLKRYYKFPLFSSWAAFIEAASTLMPVLLIGPFYGAKSLGIYFLVYRVFTAPTGLLITAVSKVMVKEISVRVKLNEMIMPLFRNISIVLMIISSLYFFVMIFISPYTSLIFGKEWNDTGVVLKIFAPIIAINLCISPLSIILLLLSRNGLDFIWQLFYMVLTVILIYTCRNEPFITMLFRLMILWLILYVIYWFMIYSSILSRDRHLVGREIIATRYCSD